MRAFLAIDFTNEIKSQITLLQNRLRNYAVSGRWKYIKNIHLTVKFLDEISEAKIPQINKALSEICSGRESFNLEISKLGSFPGRNTIRVLWLGLGGELDKLGSLHREIDTRLSEIGLERDKRAYSPHITIAQDVTFSAGFDKRAEEYLKKLPAVYVDRIYLFKSWQNGNKRIYTPVSEYIFQPA